MRIRLLLLSFFVTCALHAQTYTPKTLRVEGVPAADQQAVFDAAGLKPGVPLTKAQIEEALGKLADTGSYSDIAYTVDDKALTLKLTVAADHRAMKVRYTNFVWWPGAELEQMVEARVPLFHGEMTPDGSLADQVRAALVAIAKEKGLTIEVDTTKRNGEVALSIDKPLITSGTLHVDEVKPLAGGTFEDLKKGLQTLEFDEVLTADTIEHDTAEIYNNAGYLQATVDPPVFAAPRADGAKYVVDATETVHPNALYHVGAVELHTPEVKDTSVLTRSESLHMGEPVSPMLVQLSTTSIELGYHWLGYLDAKVVVTPKNDETAHTVGYTFDATPGEVYHLARISVEGSLPPALGEALQHNAKLKAGVVAGEDVQRAAQDVLKQQNATRLATMELKPNPADHTATLVVRPMHLHAPPTQ